MLKNNLTKTRQSNFELLRIVCILMILTLHYCNSKMGGALDIKNVPEGTFNYYFVRILESLSIVAVNCFILITGFFSNKSMKIKAKKVFNLLFILLFYNIAIYIVAIALKIQNFDNESFNLFFISLHKLGCWFIILYIILYLMIPFINLIINNISKKQFKFLIIVMIIAFSLYPTFLSDTTVKDEGYGIVNFVMLYLIGAYINRFNLNNKNGAIYFITYILMQLLTFINCINKFTVSGAFAYNSIFNVIGAIALFLMFSRFRFKSKIINNISKHTLGIYIIHVNIFMYTFLWKTLLKTDSFYTSKYLALNCIKSVFVIFIAGLVIDIIREKLFNITIEKAFKNNKIYNYELKIEGASENE